MRNVVHKLSESNELPRTFRPAPERVSARTTEKRSRARDFLPYSRLRRRGMLSRRTDLPMIQTPEHASRKPEGATFTMRNHCLLALLLLGVAAPAQAEFEVALDASRVAGVAPLAVRFNAIVTSGASAEASIQELTYHFDFGDPSGERWSYSGKEKNLQCCGRVAAHVFESPGTYEVRVVARSVAQELAEASATIRVDDPDTVYAGENTICFAATNAGDFSGCPAGALQERLSATGRDFDDAVRAHIAPRRRLLFRRGDSYAASESIVVNDSGPGTIGAFGPASTPRPIVTTQQGGFMLADLRKPLYDDWRIMDLDLRGPGAENGVWMAGYANRLLTLRLRLSHYRCGIMQDGHLMAWTWRNDLPFGIWAEMFHVENEIFDTTAWGVFISSQDSALLGNRAYQTYSHTFRLPLWYDGIVAHNELVAPDTSSRHILKFNAESPRRTDAFFAGWPSENFVIADNRFIGSPMLDWDVHLGPQNDTSQSDEEVRMGVVENNLFIAGSRTRNNLRVQGHHIMVRNNILIRESAQSDALIALIGPDRTASGFPPAHVGEDNIVVNNVCYTNGPAGSSDQDCVGLQGGVRRAIVRNNLYYSVQDSGDVVADDSGESQSIDHNRETALNPFLGPLGEPAGFALAPDETVAAGQGIAVPGAQVDLFGRCPGPGTQRLDLGAIQSGAIPCPVPSPVTAPPQRPTLLP